MTPIPHWPIGHSILAQRHRWRCPAVPVWRRRTAWPPRCLTHKTHKTNGPVLRRPQIRTAQFPIDWFEGTNYIGHLWIFDDFCLMKLGVSGKTVIPSQRASKPVVLCFSHQSSTFNICFTYLYIRFHPYLVVDPRNPNFHQFTPGCYWTNLTLLVPELSQPTDS